MTEANLVRPVISIFDTRVAFSTSVMKEAPSLQTHCRTSNEFCCQEKDLNSYAFNGRNNWY